MKPDSYNVVIKITQIIILLVISTTLGHAAAVYRYDYIGNNYNDFSTNQSSNIYDGTMRMEISFTTNTLLTNFAGDAAAFVTSFSFYDGIYSLTDSDATSRELFNLNTDSSGNILQWEVEVWNPAANSVGATSSRMLSIFVNGGQQEDNASYRLCTSAPFGNCLVAEDYTAVVSGMPGTWALSAVPTPPALYLFGSGLLGLVGVARKKAA